MQGLSPFFPPPRLTPERACSQAMNGVKYIKFQSILDYSVGFILIYIFLSLFQALMAEINLSEDLVYYFGLFLIKRAEDGEAASKLINPLSPKSDKHLISPYSITS